MVNVECAVCSVPQWSRHNGGKWYWTAPVDILLSVVKFESLFPAVEALVSNVSTFIYEAFLEVFDDMLLFRQTQTTTPHPRLVYTALFKELPADVRRWI